MDRRGFLFGAAASPSAAASRLRRDPATALPAPPGPEPDEKYWHELRWHFHLPREAVYLNTATLGASPRSVLAAVHEHARWVEEQLVTCDYAPDRPIYLAGYEDEPALRARLARMLGGAQEEVALTRNATVGMNFVAMGLELARGDEVVLTNMEHPGGRCGYDVRAKRDGIVIREVEIPVPPPDPAAIVARFAAAIGPRTKVVAIPHVTSALGIVLPVAEIARLARQRGAFVVVDGAQGLGHVPVDVRAMGCDAYFASPHKWLLAPKGSGVFWIAKEAAPKVWTTLASSEWNNQDDPGRRFMQIGTGNMSLHKGFEAALDFVDRIGLAAMQARIRQLGDAFRKALVAMPHVHIRSATHPQLCAGIVTFTVDGWEARALHEHLWREHRLMPRSIGEFGVRASFHVYDTLADVQRFTAALARLAS
ncbi:MAG: aminotransferase class V-fold PLP-dependent enzyme [Planctomycetes bacterium]|nr:aminotransferase class V-fold PLP-dependent enzyme [Planctomycetota bacterium]